LYSQKDLLSNFGSNHFVLVFSCMSAGSVLQINIVHAMAGMNEAITAKPKNH
jgi:hypothetical protein